MSSPRLLMSIDDGSNRCVVPMPSGDDSEKISEHQSNDSDSSGSERGESVWQIRLLSA
jgi:hypothetical protein